MNVTLEEAITIYARASRKWFGPLAHQKTQERIEQLARTGDLDGVAVWERVKGHISLLEQTAGPADKADEPLGTCAA